MPDDPGLQERVEHLRVRNADVIALLETGRLHDARDLAEELLLEARAIGFAPVIGEMAHELGSAYLQFGRHAEALSLLEEAVLVARAHGMNQLTWEAQLQLILLHVSFTGDHELADWLLRDVEALGKSLGDRPLNRGEVLLARGRLERNREHFAAAEEALRAADALFDRHGAVGVSHVVTLDLLASVYMDLQQPVDALEVLDRAERIATDTIGAAHPLRGNLLTHKARARSSQGRHEEAVSLLRAAGEVFEGAYGEIHPNISAVANGLGLQLESTGRPSESVEAFRRAYTVAEKVFGTEHLQVAIIEQNLGNTLRRLGRPEEALPLHRHAVSVRERSLPADALSRFDSRDNLADDLRTLGRCDDAEVEYRSVIDARERLGGIATPSIGYPLTGLALCRMARGEVDQAIVDLERAIAVLSTDAGWDTTIANAKMALAVTLRTAGREPERVQTLLRDAKVLLDEDPLGHAPLLEQLRAFAAGEAIGTLLY